MDKKPAEDSSDRGGQIRSLPHTHGRQAVEDPDLAIARRAADGDMGAFDALVSLYNARVFAVAFRMLGDRAEAEDLAQEVFVAVYHALPEFRGDSKLSTWMYRITKNRCLNRIKFLKRRRIGEHQDIQDPVVAGQVGDPLQQKRDPRRLLEQQELSALVQTGLQKLSPEQRELVVLRDLEDLSYEEIVHVTGLQLGTVKSRLHRARAHLARILAPVVQSTGGLEMAT